ncbi:DNA polymerase I, thermostable [Shimia thalassica]|uniref:DNA-directed DNA polymerase n=1 Tax=Shimia thalassica TaxID=1715693 RepID=A0A0P1I7A8_9RHOB|nr:DNA polymerase [Shimia thalassica]CUJ94718.1 DNA polymerase I, thermostable [Shimia thalassica]
MTIAVFSFIKNFSSSSISRFFLSDFNGFREVTAKEVSNYEGYLITHDYWMICRDLFESAGALPRKVIDLDEYRVFVSRNNKDRLRREKIDIIEEINRIYPTNYEACQRYKKIFYGEVDVDAETVSSFHEILTVYYIELCRHAHINGEFHRFIEIEVPCQLICSLISSQGLPVDNAKITEFRAQARHEYYTNLRDLSDKFDVPLERPSNKDVERYAVAKGVDFEEYSFEFVLNFMPQIRDYTESVLTLRELDLTRGVLDSIAVKDSRVHPVLDTQGSRTSRISVRSPFLQSLAKRYRSILCAAEGFELCYVDFDQFEVGIMAALSGDPELLRLFSEPDMYETFRIEHLNGEGSRQAAKILFLAYAYGMKLNNLPIVGQKFGVGRSVVRNAFKKFKRYEIWKQEVLKSFKKTGFVSTSFGNRFYFLGSKPSNKEQLSAISQVVQGEGSLIFKKALIKISRLDNIQMLLPMHDALLFQYSATDSPEVVVDAFKKTMSEHFEGIIEGKASVENFGV